MINATTSSSSAATTPLSRWGDSPSCVGQCAEIVIQQYLDQLPLRQQRALETSEQERAIREKSDGFKRKGEKGLPTLETSHGKFELLTGPKTDPESCLLLGEGSFKKAYGALRYPNRTLYAVLVMTRAPKEPEEPWKDYDENWKEDCKDMEHEIKIMKQLKNVPNTLQLLAHYKLQGEYWKDQLYYLIVELGQDMSKVVAKGLTQSRLRLYSDQMANGLAGLHALRLVHRDVKLQNFIVSEDGTVYLSDFGGTCGIYDEKRLCGYVSTYPAPEQAKNFDATSGSFTRPKYTTQASDLWALGLTLYSLHHRWPGTPLIPGACSSVLEATKEITQETIDSDLYSSIRDRGYRELIGDLLKVDPAERITSCVAAQRLQRLSKQVTR
jgi:serine/threonine protein kinase